MKKKKDDGKSEVMPNIGTTIQRLRRAYKLSLGGLAEQSGVSKSIISQIERNECNPTLATIWRLSNALETSIDVVLKKDEPEPFFPILTAQSTPIIQSEDGLCQLRVVGALETVEWVQWYIFTAQPKGILDSSPHQIGSVEHLTVLNGEIEVEVAGKTAHAKTGMTLRFKSDQPHAIRNIGKVDAEVLMVLVLKSAVLV